MLKGSMLDLIFIMVFVIAVVIGGIISAKVYFSIADKLKENNMSVEILDEGGKAINNFLNAVPIIILAMGVGAIILAFLIPSHPAFAPISFILLVLYMTISMTFSNVLYRFLSSESIVSVANQYPLLATIATNLHWIIGTIGFILIVVMYSKSRW